MRAKRLTAAVIWAAMAPVAGAQDRPTTVCAFDGFDANPEIAEVITTQRATGYFGCSTDSNCTAVTLAPGDPVIVYRVAAAWTCAYLSSSAGAGPGWIGSKDIRLVLADSNPALKAWAGTWKGGEDLVTIGLSKTAGELDLNGKAVWHGRADVVHTGDFAGTAAPHGNHLHFAGGSTADSCIVDLTLAGKYVVAGDNNHCGGLNARFQGVWKRAAR